MLPKEVESLVTEGLQFIFGHGPKRVLASRIIGRAVANTVHDKATAMNKRNRIREETRAEQTDRSNVVVLPGGVEYIPPPPKGKP